MYVDCSGMLHPGYSIPCLVHGYTGGRGWVDSWSTWRLLWVLLSLVYIFPVSTQSSRWPLQKKSLLLTSMCMTEFSAWILEFHGNYKTSWPAELLGRFPILREYRVGRPSGEAYITASKVTRTFLQRQPWNLHFVVCWRLSRLLWHLLSPAPPPGLCDMVPVYSEHGVHTPAVQTS